MNKSYNKYHKLVVRDIIENHDVSEAQLNFMLFVYDYEFFTLDHISQTYFYSKVKLARRIIYPLQNNEYIYKYFDKLSPKSYEEAIFHEKKMQYRVRYSISQKGRLLIQRYYRKLEGNEQIIVPS
tara:strand:- start:2688 stop:3062 length:375 start_codon:yes stop_codon:yes gene_type:complete